MSFVSHKKTIIHALACCHNELLVALSFIFVEIYSGNKGLIGCLLVKIFLFVVFEGTDNLTNF